MSRLGDWLDERSGWRATLAHFLDEPIPGGPQAAYVFGSVLLALVLLQAVTGAVLAAHYAPSVSDAWASVAFIEDQLTLGWFLRGLHATGASATIVVMGAHLVQTALWGAYRKPRELNWIVGVLLLGTVLAFALTGYLLPFDQKGYWATQVATALVGAVPVSGHALERVLLGGETFGNLTLTHFYALHVIALPALVLLLVVVHVALMRRHGVTPSSAIADADLAARARPFWPGQALRDLAAIAIAVVAVALWVMHEHGAGLEAPADPTSSYDARPEWYFTPLFELLKLFPGRSEVVAALVAPLVLGGIFLGLPFFDRSPSRAPRDRKLPLILLGATLFALVWLGVRAHFEDARSESYQAQRQVAAAQATRARELAKKGMPPSGGTAVYENDPGRAARGVFAFRCSGCHSLAGEGEARAPLLDGWGTQAWVRKFLVNPDDATFYGPTKLHEMKATTGTPEDLDALAAYVTALGGSKVDDAPRARGEKLFADTGCDMCHETDGTGDSQGGPNLGGWGSAAWLHDFLVDPAQPRFFGRRNQMPKFGDKLKDEDILGLAKLIAVPLPKR